MRPVYLVFVLTACGGVRGVDDPTPPRPMGVQGNLAEAQKNEDAAKDHEIAADEAEARARQHELACGDMVLQEQATSGGEELMARTPCWSSEASGVDHHRQEAAKLRADARSHRALARELRQAERANCVGLREVSHTPFAHTDDITAVAAIVEHGAVRGARIRFRPVRDLDAAWLRRAISCQQARAAALGWEPTHAGYDPTLLPGAEVEVTDDKDGPVVSVRSSDEMTAIAIYGRAEALLDPTER